MNRTVSLYMVKDPVSVLTDASLDTIMKKMDKSKLSHLLVENNDNNLVGIISKKDILKRLRYLLSETTGKTYSTKVKESTKAIDVMTEYVIYLKPDDSVEYAVEMLLQNEFHCLPVVDKGKPVGILTLYDLLKGYYQEFG